MEEKAQRRWQIEVLFKKEKIGARIAVQPRDALRETAEHRSARESSY